MEEPDVRVGGAAFEARDDPDGSLVNVRSQIFRRFEQPQKALPAHARGRFTNPISCGATGPSPARL